MIIHKLIERLIWLSLLFIIIQQTYVYVGSLFFTPVPHNTLVFLIMIIITLLTESFAIMILRPYFNVSEITYDHNKQKFDE